MRWNWTPCCHCNCYFPFLTLVFSFEKLELCIHLVEDLLDRTFPLARIVPSHVCKYKKVWNYLIYWKVLYGQDKAQFCLKTLVPVSLSDCRCSNDQTPRILINIYVIIVHYYCSLYKNYFLPKVIDIWCPIFFMIGQVVNTIWYELLPFTLVYWNEAITHYFLHKNDLPCLYKNPNFRCHHKIASLLELLSNTMVQSW